MAKFEYLVHLDLVQNELQNAIIQNLGTAPGSPLDGQIYYDTTVSNHRFRGYIDGSWEDFLTTTSTYIASITITEGTGVSITSGGTATDPTYTINLDYIGVDNFIDSATDLEGSAIATTDTIAYHDATDDTVKKGLISDLPFDPAGTDNSTAVTLAATVTDVLTLSTQEIGAVDAGADSIAGWDDIAGDFTYLTPTQVRTIINVADGANNYTHPNHSGDVSSVNDGATTAQPAIITGKAAITVYTNLTGTDEFLIHEDGVGLKRLDLDVLEAYMQNNLIFGGTYDFDAGANQGANQTVNASDLLDITASAATTAGSTPIETEVSKASTTVTVAIKLDFIDDDTFATATNTNIPSAESVKAYVDSVAQGLDAKDSVRVATDAAGTLASSFENGDTVDGIILATNDRILIKNQAAPAENGIYTVNASGAPTRSTDADSWDELISAFVFVEEGTANADTGWVCTVDAGGTLGSTAVTFAQFSGAGSYTAGNGIDLGGTVFSLTVPTTNLSGTSTNAVSGTGHTHAIDTGIADNDIVAIDSASVNSGEYARFTANGLEGRTVAEVQSELGVTQKFAVDLHSTEGSVSRANAGGVTTFTVTHNLGTTDITYSVKRISDSKIVGAEMDTASTNTVDVAFNDAGNTNDDLYRVTIIG